MRLCAQTLSSALSRERRAFISKAVVHPPGSPYDSETFLDIIFRKLHHTCIQVTCSLLS